MRIIKWGILLLFILLAAHKAQAQSQVEIERLIIRAAIRHNIDPKLALAIAEVESRLNPKAIGTKGEIGLFQLRPEFHSALVHSMYANANIAMKYLAKLKDRCRHYGNAYFVCYNYGPTRQLKHPRLFPYYRKVMAALARRRQMQVVSND